MKIPIDLFESHISEDILLAGENLYDQDAVESMSIMGLNLYSLKIKDEKNYEVELKMGRDQVKLMSCECQKVKSANICNHMVCALFYFRAHVWGKNKKSSKKKQSKAKSIKIDQILDQISPEQLLTFVRTYSRRDPKFALAFKIKFLPKIEHSQDQNPYKLILDQIIKPKTSKNVKPSASDIKIFKTTLNEFFDQCQDHLSLHKYENAFQILKISLTKLYYLLNQLEKHDDQLIQLLSRGSEGVAYLLETEISPTFRSRILTFLMELLNSSYFQVYCSPSNFMELLFQLSLEQEKQGLIHQILQSKFNHLQIVHYSKISYALYLFLLERLEGQDQYQWLLSQSIDFNIQLIKRLFARNDLEGVEKLLLLNESSRKLRPNLLAGYWIRLYEKQSRIQELTELSLRQFESSGMLQYYLKAKNARHPQWSALKANLEKELYSQYETQGRSLIYELLATENELEKIKDLIQSKMDFAALYSYTPKLLALAEDQFTSLVKQMFDYLIAQHAGAHLHRQIISYLKQLERYQAFKIKRNLIDHIEKKYNYRKALIRELSSL